MKEIFELLWEDLPGRIVIFLGGICVVVVLAVVSVAIYDYYTESVQAHQCESRKGEWGVVGWHWGWVSHGKSGSSWETIDDYGCREYKSESK